MIFEELRRIQNNPTSGGFLPAAELRALSKRTGTPLYRLQEVASFFPHFRLEKPPTADVKLCRDMACHLHGAGEILRKLHALTNEFDARQLAVDGVSCLGRCDRGPVACINHQFYSQGSLGDLESMIRETIAGRGPVHDSDPPLALIDPTAWKIDPYAGKPAYRAVREFMANPDPRRVLKELETADLLGMGGAGAPAARKWTDVWQAASPDGEKYIVCNGDESEPGTFKDREIFLHKPYLVVEGVILAGLVLGATRGYIFIRHEYAAQIEAVRRAVAEAEKQGVCGPQILGQNRSFNLEVVESPGGYICGEQGALIETLEEKRAQPRNRPPQLETNGLWNKPTLLSNVETFAWAVPIAIHGGAWYAEQGLNGCKGLRFFSISGDVKRPGAHEVPIGLPLGELINGCAGGTLDGRPPAAIAPSGPSGGFLPAKLPLEGKRLPDALKAKLPPGATHLNLLDLPLDLALFRQLGLMLGAGIVIYGQGTDMLDQAVNCTEFFRNESCGKCVPCRVGSQKLVEIAGDFSRSSGNASDFDSAREIVRDLVQAMEMTSICGLGVAAPNPLVSWMKYFRSEPVQPHPKKPGVEGKFKSAEGQPMSDEFLNIAAVRDEEEGLFARDVSGQLLRLAPATAADFDKEITLTIDGQSVTVKKAVPATDSQGNPLKDSMGRAIPRATTIYDAARQLFVKQIGDKNPIPVLCHQDHVDPVAVCRVCVVEIAKMKRGKITRERKLLPACQHRVEDTMEVQTIESPDPAARERVRSAVKVLTELLVGDHLQGRSAHEVLAEQPFNELAALAVRLGVEKSRFTPPPADRGHDSSSALFAVDHTACILCDRCVRGCTDVRDNRIIGHTQKGYSTRIAFDLDDPMGESGCVSCGECMISCPTGALTLRSGVEQAEQGDDSQGVSVAQLKQIPLFSNISYKFLQWNSRSITRRMIRPGEVLCREGESGSTAFVLLSGRYEVFLQTSLRHIDTKKTSGLRAFVGRIKTSLSADRSPSAADGAKAMSVRNDGNMPVPLGGSALLGPPEDLILGEMTCLNHYPRSATVVAKEAGEVLEIGRNVLYMLQRDKVARELLGRAYRKRALKSHLQDISLFKNLSPGQRAECIEFLRNRVELVHIDPGQVIFRQGDPADHFYMVRLGFVKVAQTYRGEQLVLDYLGPGSHFGEIGLLSQVSNRVAFKYPAGMASGIRTASCTALDDVELVRIRGEHFRELLEMHVDVSDLIVKEAERLLEKDAVSRERLGGKLGDFLEQGLFNAQKLLVLDLEACTRCDECTKACADSHEGVTRLIREGLRFDKFLVASSCRSCLDPYCLVGCPVDAIHRRPRDKDSPNALEIVIEDWCIGCSQCAKNCPYGNINMHAIEDLQPDPEQPERMRKVVQHKATTCDLCRDIVSPDGDVSCVYACPHNAAFRMSGEQLFGLVNPLRS